MLDIVGLVGRRVAETRRKAGLTQEELSERSGVSVRMLLLMETGKTACSVLTLDALATALHAPITSLLHEPDDLDGRMLLVLSGRTAKEKECAIAIVEALISKMVAG